MHIPTEFGGLGFSALAGSTIVQKISTKSLSAAVTVMVPNSLGPAELLIHYGTNEQKQKYLRRLAVGAEVPCFGLTSSEAGSDAGAIIDQGIITRGTFEGQKDVIGIKLTWSKRYITLAPVATLIGLAVKIYDPDKILGNETDLGITVVLLPTSTPGVEVGKRHFPLNQAFLNGPTSGKDVFVPLDYIIGGKERIGQGWKMLVECLASGRGVSLPALATATGKHCFRVTGAYAKIRQQFNLSVGKFEGVGSVLARIGGFTYMLESTRLLTVGAVDQNIKPAIVTAIAKYHMTEMGRQVINDAMDVNGGRGIQLGPRNYLGNIYQGYPVSITVEGANILTRCLMIFGQGAVRCHPYVLKEMNAVNNKDQLQGLLDFDKAICAHMRYGISNFAKLKLHSYTGMHFCSSVDSPWKRYYQRFSFFSLALACCADAAMLFLGGDLKRKENLSARLGDVLSYLYIASAVLKYDNDNGNKVEDEIYVRWSLDYCLYQIQLSLEYFLINFPVRWFAKPMQWLIFLPWRNFRLPSDKLSIEIAHNMMQPSAFRDRLTDYCAKDSDPKQAAGRVEQAWLKMISVEPLLSKIDAAVKQGKIKKTPRLEAKFKSALEQNIITEAEYKDLTQYDAMRLDALQVDEFTKAELTGKKS